MPNAFSAERCARSLVMELILYYAPAACSLVPYVTLTEAGASFTVRNVNTRKGENRSADYRRVNPKGKVPVLVIDGDPLTENVAIQLWIARAFPHARLLPLDPMQEIKAISLMSWFASGIHPHLTPNARPERYCDLPGSEEAVKRVANRLLLEDFDLAEHMLARRDWFFEHFTAVDAYFFWCFRRAILFELDVAAFGHCLAHYERMQTRRSVQRVLAYERQVQAAFAAAN
jgi:glutathione S-transferase